MKILHSASTLVVLLTTGVHAQQAYDVVIVGSGPGGLVAAEFLSRESSVSVLILEAGLPSLQATGGTDGPSYASSKGWTKFDIPGEYDGTIYNPANDKYRVDWNSGPYMWLGKLVGGCSSINAALYFRPPDAYVTSSKWPMSPARVASLMNENEQIHGATDTPSPDGKYYLQEAYTIVANAFKNTLGYTEKTINDPVARNSKSKSFGHAPFTFKGGLRDTPAKAFWNQMKNRPNVKLVTSAMVSYIKQWQGKATSVVYNTNVEVPLTARGAVIMAAGALGTPKVLIQSGVGPQDQLNLLNARSDFPGVKASANGGWVVNGNVGKSLFDTNVVFASFSHPNMQSFQYKNKPQYAIDQYMNQGQTGGWASSGPVLIGYENYAVNGRMYEFQTTVLTNGFGSFYSNGNAFTTALYVNNPESRDATSFSADGKWNVLTQGSAYMGTTNDLNAMQNYATRVVDALKANGATFLSAANGQSVGDWVNANRGFITHHFGGSCYASSDSSDSKRCADEKLRVIGTSNIFVGDATAMRDGTVNPYGYIMYIGREAAEQVKAQLANPPQPSTCNIENGIDYIGNDIGSAVGVNAEACCTVCQNRAGCGAFSWTNYAGGTCWLKSAKGTTKVDASVRSGTLTTTTPTPPPTTPTPPPSTCSIENNVDYAGNDIGNAASATAEGCCSICKARSGCAAFTWTDYAAGTCWLKSGKGTTSAKTGARSSVVSTTPPSPQCSTIELNVDYAGNDMGNAPSATVDGCCGICAQRSGCGAYTWTDYLGGTCWLKTSKGATSAKTGAKSGVYTGGANTCTLTNDIDYFGNDIGSSPSGTAAGCCSICKARSGCVVFTWTSQDGGTCWLKNLQGTAVAKAGAIAGKI